MKTDTSQQLIDFIEDRGAVTPAQIATHLHISLQMVHRHLKAQLEAGRLQKTGAPPRVLYRLAPLKEDFHFPDLPLEQTRFIEANYFTVSPSGERLAGLAGFKAWAQRTRQHLQFAALSAEYVDAMRQLDKRYRKRSGLIDAGFKIRETFNECYLDALWYQAFYSIPKFGKTRIGQQVLLGKSGQDVRAIRELAETCRSSLRILIEEQQIEALVFAPHSIPRKISFLKEFQRHLGFRLPTVQLAKSFPDNIPVAQKGLSKLADRIENAENTLFVMESPVPFKRLLLIDDAVGSGATLNISAQKLKKAGATFVCGYAICGSLKGFDVISEV